MDFWSILIITIVLLLYSYRINTLLYSNRINTLLYSIGDLYYYYKGGEGKSKFDDWYHCVVDWLVHTAIELSSELVLFLAFFFFLFFLSLDSSLRLRLQSRMSFYQSPWIQTWPQTKYGTFKNILSSCTPKLVAFHQLTIMASPPYNDS